MQPHALVYFDDPYFVCRVRAGGPEEQWCSVLTLQNTFGFGKYEWLAKAWNPGDFRHHWLGGFERHHGFLTDGSMGFWIEDGEYKVISSWDGALEHSPLSGQDWTTERKFGVSWKPRTLEFYVDDRLITTHAETVPKAPMNFFFEAGRIGGTTPVDHAVYLRKNSFTSSY